MTAFAAYNAFDTEDEVPPPPRLNGYMGGDANVISDAINAAMRTHTLTYTQVTLLGAIHRHTFGNAGFHRRRGQDEHTTPFELATWARMLEWHKPNLLRTRDQLIALGVLLWAPDPDAPGCGRLGWNMNLDAWLPLDETYRTTQRARHSRPGAGAPRGPRNTAKQQPSVITGITSVEYPSDNANNPADNASLPKKYPSDNAGHIPVITLACRDAANQAGAEASLKKAERNRSGPARSAEVEYEETSGEASGNATHVRETPLPAMFQAILDVLHAIPGWREHAVIERRALDRACAPSDETPTGVGTLPTAFVAHRAEEFSAWLDTSRIKQSIVDPLRDPTGIGAFEKFLARKTAERLTTWRREHAQVVTETHQTETRLDRVARGLAAALETPEQRQERETAEMVNAQRILALDKQQRDRRLPMARPAAHGGPRA